jgi:hypothetical protein
MATFYANKWEGGKEGVSQKTCQSKLFNKTFGKKSRGEPNLAWQYLLYLFFCPK